MMGLTKKQFRDQITHHAQMVEEDKVLNAAVFIHCVYMADISGNHPGQSDMSEI